MPHQCCPIYNCVSRACESGEVYTSLTRNVLSQPFLTTAANTMEGIVACAFGYRPLTACVKLTICHVSHFFQFVFHSVCTPTDPCQNGGVCDEVADSCTCNPPYAGDVCDKCELVGWICASLYRTDVSSKLPHT